MKKYWYEADGKREVCQFAIVCAEQMVNIILKNDKYREALVMLDLEFPELGVLGDFRDSMECIISDKLHDAEIGSELEIHGIKCGSIQS